MSTSVTSNHENESPDTNSGVPIRFRGALTVADAYAAISLAQPLGNKIAAWTIRVFFAAALVYMGWLTVHASAGSEHNLARMAFAGVLLVLLPICLVVGREIWFRKRAHQLCEKGKYLYAPTEGEIGSDSIRSKSESGEVTLNWSAFCGYRNAGTVAVLYQHYPASYVIMSRSKFADDQDWASFLELAGKKLKRR